MTFEGDEIGFKPTMQQIELYIAQRGLYVTPQQVWDYWEKKDWLTLKGAPVKTLETAIHVVNGIAISHDYFHGTKLKGQSKTARKKEKKKILLEAQLKAKEISENNCKKQPYSKYDDQLKDERWSWFRNFIFKIRGRKCEICGSNEYLQVHHLLYHSNCKAWEYSCKDVIVVCRNCHKKLHGIK